MTLDRFTVYPVTDPMSRFGANPLAFPEFRGAPRRLILWNLVAYFAMALTQLPALATANRLALAFSFAPDAFLHGALWQPITYSFVHVGLLGTLFELLSLWFLAGFLENYHKSAWIIGLYAVSVLGTAAAAVALYVCSQALGFASGTVPLYGCFGGIFGLLVAIGALYGDMQFLLFPLPIGIKARYLVAIYALVTVAMLFGQQRMYAFAQLGGALAGLLYIRLAPRHGFSVSLSEPWYAARNRYYRWKRRRAARKFEVYMRSQGRTVHFDGNGHPIEDDSNDKSRWN
jgi:membrane associated rhomboid family serine protease